MANIVVFYWCPGSGGDFVNKLFLERPLEYQVVQETITLSSPGRATPKLDQFFIENFPSDINQWYWRGWTASECDLLTDIAGNLDCKWFVVPTHRLDQVDYLKSQIPNITSIGITYPSNMFPLILKNWCKKVAAFDPDLQEIYNKPLHQYMKLHNTFGEFVLKEQLTYGTRLITSIEYIFDTEISLEDIYNSDLRSVKALFSDHSHVDNWFNDWFQRQSKLHSHCYDVPQQLKQSLGFNSKSRNYGDLSANLDTFDNILIKNHSTNKNLPNFKTLQQAADFLKTSKADN